MRRRELVGALAAGLTVTAGCLSLGGGENDGGDRSTTRPGTFGTPSATPSSTGSDATDGDSDGGPAPDSPAELDWGDTFERGDLALTPRNPTTQHSMLALAVADAMEVLEPPPGEQLLFVSVDVGVTDDADVPRPGQFVLESGAGRHRGWTSYGNYDGYSLAPDGRRGSQYDTDDDPGGWVGFSVPVPLGGGGAGDEDRDAPSLAFEPSGGAEPAVRWSLPDETVAALGDPGPSLSVSDVAIPSSVEEYDPLTVSFTVTNEGDGPGTFRGAVNLAGSTWAADPVVGPTVDPGDSQRVDHEVLRSVRGDLEVTFVTADGEFDGRVSSS